MRKLLKVENAPYRSIPQDVDFFRTYDEVHNEEYVWDEEEEMVEEMGEIVLMRWLTKII